MIVLLKVEVVMPINREFFSGFKRPAILTQPAFKIFIRNGIRFFINCYFSIYIIDGYVFRIQNNRFSFITILVISDNIYFFNCRIILQRFTCINGIEVLFNIFINIIYIYILCCIRAVFPSKKLFPILKFKTR